MKCTTENCFNKILCKGLCTKCYYRIKRGGTPELSKKQLMALRICSIKGCSKPHVANDLCAMHNRRLQRHGDPNFVNPKCNRDGNYKQRAKVKSALWKKTHPKLNSAFNQARKNRLRKSPKQQRNAIKQFYLNCPAGFVVDHIIPLTHRLVYGLHVPWNLQYLPVKDNLLKSNKFDGTYENESWRK